MLKTIRQQMVVKLWQRYHNSTLHMQTIQAQFNSRNVNQFVLDHFAIIDLPGPYSGIKPLQQLFSLLGYTTRGCDYLPEKQNDFLWMAETDCLTTSAIDVLPQIVVADFRLSEMPIEIQNIILNYSQQTRPAPLATMQSLISRLENKETVHNELIDLLIDYLSGRDWPLPSIKEFNAVHAFNELLAWVLIFGRRPNHFTLAIHLLSEFQSFEEFLEFVDNDMQLPLNIEGGLIKGGVNKGIAQASTKGALTRVQLADGEVQVPSDFVEFVWRYPVSSVTKPVLWQDYFTGFIAQHADRVIESLYC